MIDSPNLADDLDTLIKFLERRAVRDDLAGHPRLYQLLHDGELPEGTAEDGEWSEELRPVLHRLRTEAAVRRGATAPTSPYTQAPDALYPRWSRRVERVTYANNVGTTHVRANIHLSDLPEDPRQLAAAFATLPDHARVLDDDENPGWFEISWNEPSTDADRAKAAAKAAEEAERAEFERWTKERQAGAFQLGVEARAAGEEREPPADLAVSLRPSWDRGYMAADADLAPAGE